MLIDSHAHLPKGIKESQEILERAKFADVRKIINIGTDLEENEKALKVTTKFDNVYASLGIYPHSHREISPTEIFELFKTQLNNFKENSALSKKIVAIGECGIDITNWEKQRTVEDQINLFELQIQLAMDHKLPIVIHNRNGDEIVLKLINKYKDDVRFIAHCYDSTWETAQKLIDMGVYISFSGFITYNSKKYLLEIVEKVPQNQYLVETDSPYIVPKGVKEKPNEPKNVRIVAEKVAQIRKTAFEDVSEQTYNNTVRAFNLS